MQLKSNKAVFSSLSDLLNMRSEALSFGLRPEKKNVSLISGQQRSFFKTKGMNFEEVRPYQQGDDARQIDWRVTAKHGKPFTKVYVDDTIHQVYLLTDLQNQMFFASHGDFKSVVAARVNALISWITLNQKGVLHQVVLSNDGAHSFKAIQTEENLTAFFKQLLKLMPRANNPQTDYLGQGIQSLRKQLKKGEILFVISDFQNITPDFVQNMRQISAKQSVVLIHIFDLMEKKLPNAVLSFSDGVSDITIDARSREVQKMFATLFQKRQTIIQKAAKEMLALYVPLQTHEDYIYVLTQQLNKRGLAHGK